MKSIKCFLIIILASCFVFHTHASKPQINWIKPEQAFLLNQGASQKKVFVDVYTTWCGWCKKMDADTFADSLVASIMNTYFHAVKFNAEQKGDVILGDKTFVNPSSNHGRSTHEWAQTILHGQLSYPSFSFLNADFSTLTIVPGYQKPEAFAMILAFFGRDEYLTYSWEEYQKIYKTEIEPEVFKDIANNQNSPQTALSFEPIKWVSPEDALKKRSKKNHKRGFVDVYTSWCGWCKKMDEKTFSNPRIAQMLNTYFTPIKFDAEHGEKLKMGKTEYINLDPGKKRSFHQWATFILDNQMKFPSFVILSEDLSTPEKVIQGFQTAEELEILLAYYGRNDHTQYEWENYKTIYQTEIKPKVEKDLKRSKK